MIELMLVTSLVLFGLTIAITLIRIILGPSLADRIFGLDMIGITLISVIAIVSILLNTNVFLDVILIFGILAFISTIAFGKYMERGVIIERKRDS
ncbi:multicomponent Na+:H+ antiporter subunit F [Virgibacillus natechei]|uniref:Multicomponent Na+:H+ antiporter subunit F n=1 Tax=Virgibacillus natechei TaxID=1216297 RepID=A0ABS4IK82_9BACI|nr:Na(+)/H(+) antiporter subunit F1 [Virgibacillus natechei]MBP1971310.1 multicomponent Na+:H+ antiporter subunit F [Virgibacillus natechei]UZD12955.1 Na(+)/H(+) antiporter subunit F1 [Virgibacillus natechei]